MLIAIIYGKICKEQKIPQMTIFDGWLAVEWMSQSVYIMIAVKMF